MRCVPFSARGGFLQSYAGHFLIGAGADASGQVSEMFGGYRSRWDVPQTVAAGITNVSINQGARLLMPVGTIRPSGPSAIKNGAAAAAKGAAREQTVAELVGGKVSGRKLTVKGLGSTDLDVLGKGGEFISVGGPAKAVDLGKFGRQLQIFKAAADENGVPALMYLEEGTPQEAIDMAKRVLGEGNVKTFTPGS